MGADDPKFIARLQRRDEAAFAELVRLHQAQVYRLALRMLGDPAEAEDLAQEIFVTVFKRIDSFRGDAKLSTWLYRVATNHCRNRIKFLGRRQHGAQKEIEPANEPGQGGSASRSTSAQLPRPDELAEGRQMEARLQRALGELDEEQRTLIVLRDLESLSYEQIQQLTGLAEGTVKSRLHRARMALRAAVGVPKEKKR